MSPQGVKLDEDTILDAARRCFARKGVHGTTMSEIAAQAGVSRTTLYRSYAGRDHVALALLQREIARFRAELERRAAAACSIEELVVSGATLVAQAWADGTFPEIDLTIEGAGPGRPGVPERIVKMPTEVITPHVVRIAELDRTEARRVSEWIVRNVLTYLLVPSADVNLRSPASIRRFIRRFVLPAVGQRVGS